MHICTIPAHVQLSFPYFPTFPVRGTPIQPLIHLISQTNAKEPLITNYPQPPTRPLKYAHYYLILNPRLY